MSRLLFLSHSGIDADAAAALRVRILASPAARERGLLVWFDKDDLRAGEPWQRQLEDAIARSHAFAVYVGSKGVVNWVEAEVRLALNRAITEPEYRFVPILAGAAPSPESLPGFAQQFQGVFDVEARPDQFDHLMRAILGSAEAGTLQLESEPFFGLRAIDETRSHLFFGRETETAGLAALVHRTPLVLVTGDSGSGKSSLVRAGLVPRFRGGGLALLDGARAQDTIWHVVTTRPRNQPLRQLGDAVDEAAKGLGLSLADRGTLADWAASGEIDKVRRGLRCGLPPERVQLLLVVDQFEELLTITPPELRTPFIDLLLELSDPADGRHRVVLTMRHDYANLCNAFERLKDRLDADDRQARFLLGRMSDQGLRRIVTEPLRLAGIDAGDREALAGEVLRDVGERPGDLALVQMALTETWRTRDQHGGDLLRAYADVGRVEGALAKAAERVRTEVLDAGQREFLDAILLRLVRLGDTGGATRRVASRGEFDAARWSLIQKLASEEGKRLLLLRGSTDQPTVEIAHEALVTAWPYFQNLLQQAADDKRILDALIPRAQAWAAEQEQTERDKRRAIGADLELFSGLLDRRATWLSGDERAFTEASTAAEEKKRQHDRFMTRALQGIAAALLIAFVFAGWMWWRADEQAEIAEKRRLEAEEQTQIAQRRAIEAETSLAWSMLEFPSGDVSVNDARALWWIATATPAAKHQSHAYLRENSHFAEVYARRPFEVIRALALAPENDATQTLTRLLASENAETRGRTVLVLLGLGATDQTAAIARLLTDPESMVRFVAVEALARLGATDQVPAIAKLLADDTLGYERENQLEALVALGATDQVPAIAKLLDTTDDADLRRSVVGALKALGATDLALQIAMRLRHPAADVRQTAVEELAMLNATDQAPAIAKLLDDPEPSVQEAAVEALTTLGAADHAPAIAAHLVDGSDSVRRRAAEALAALGATDQAPAIALLVDDPEPSVRKAAVEALATLGARDHVASIGARLTDESGEVRQAAVQALATLEATDQAAAILPHLVDGRWYVRGAAAEALAALGATDQAAAIALLVDDPEPSVRKAAVDALATLGATDQTAAIAERLATEDDAGVRTATIKALGIFGATDQVPAIAAFLSDPYLDVHQAAVEVLGTLGKIDPKAVIPVIVRHLSDDWLARTGALEALGTLDAADEVPAIAVLLHDDDVNVRQTAVEVLATLGATDQTAAIAERLTDDVSVRKAAVTALGALRASDQSGAIAILLTDDSEEVRRATVEALATLGAIDQAAAVVGHLADDSSDVRQAAAEALGMLAQGGTDELASDLAAASRRQLLVSPGSADAVAAAIVAISATMEPARAVAEIVEALKHPVLGGEHATPTLLAGLQARFPEAPGPDRGLYPNLAWIEAEFPEIDLKSPPKDDGTLARVQPE